MSRRLEFLLIFVFAVAASFLGTWLMNPANTPLHGWLVPSLGEGGARFLRIAVVGLLVGLAFFAIRTVSRARRASHGA